MTNSITPPPPHLLKKFSEQARVSSQKRGAPNYLKTFAILCIEWAFQEVAMEDLRVASAAVSGVELNSQSTPNDRQIRSSDITPPPELVQQWDDEGTEMFRPEYQLHLATRAAQWGADQELEACCEWLRTGYADTAKHLRIARRPTTPSLKEEALGGLDQLAVRLTEAGVAVDLDTIRRALEAMPDEVSEV